MNRTTTARAAALIGAVFAGLVAAPRPVVAATPPATPAASPSPAPDTGVRDASGDTGSAQTEQTIAVDPTNPNNIIIGFISGISVSHDGGLTWKLGTPTCSGDNNPAFDASGRAYFECDNNGVISSNNAGDTWGPAVTAYSGTDNNGDLADRPWLVRGVGPHTLYIGFESFFSTPVGWVFVKHSTDGGDTWPEPSDRVDDGAPGGAGNYPAQQNPREFPAVGGDGTLYVAYASGQQPFIVPDIVPTSFVVARSRDGGATLDRAVAAADITRTKAPTEETEAISSLAADPDPTRANHLVLAWADQRSGESRILMVSSVDGGQTWSAPVDATDDPPGSGNNHDHPQVAFAPDGRVVLVWRDRRCCGGTFTSNYQLFARTLTITATGIEPDSDALQVTDSPQAPNPITGSDEYLGLAVGPEGVSVAWNQPINGFASTYFRRIPLSSFSEAATGLPEAPWIPALAVMAVIATALGRRRQQRRRERARSVP